MLSSSISIRTKDRKSSGCTRIYGYDVIRQSGSHIRLTTTRNGEHHLTVPNHKPLRLGTLSELVADVAGHFGMTRDEVTRQLFGH